MPLWLIREIDNARNDADSDVHLTQETIDLYRTIAEPDSDTARKSARWLYEHIKHEITGQLHLKILIPGIGTGWFAVNLINAFLEDQNPNFKEVYFDIVDRDPIAFAEFSRLIGNPLFTEEDSDCRSTQINRQCTARIRFFSYAIEQVSALDEDLIADTVPAVPPAPQATSEIGDGNEAGDENTVPHAIRLPKSHLSSMLGGYDAVVSLFSLHNYRLYWGEMTDFLSDFIRPGGLLVLGERGGDFGSWCGSFDTMCEFDTLRDDPARLRFLMLARKFLRVLEEAGWFCYWPVSMATVQPVVDRLTMRGECPFQELLFETGGDTFSFTRTYSVHDWFRALALYADDTRVLDFAPHMCNDNRKADLRNTLLERLKNAYRNALESLSSPPASEPNEIKITNEAAESWILKANENLRMRILLRCRNLSPMRSGQAGTPDYAKEAPQHERAQNLNGSQLLEPSLQRDLRGLFLLLPPPKLRNQPISLSEEFSPEVDQNRMLVWRKDLIALLVHGAIKHPAAALLVHSSVDNSQWIPHTPMLCRRPTGDSSLASVLLYYALAHRWPEHRYWEVIPRFLFRETPDKAVIDVTYVDEGEIDVDVSLRRNGSVDRIAFTVPRSIVRENIRKEFQRFLNSPKVAATVNTGANALRKDYSEKLGLAYDGIYDILPNGDLTDHFFPASADEPEAEESAREDFPTYSQSSELQPESDPSSVSVLLEAQEEYSGEEDTAEPNSESLRADENAENSETGSSSDDDQEDTDFETLFNEEAARIVADINDLFDKAILEELVAQTRRAFETLVRLRRNDIWEFRDTGFKAVDRIEWLARAIALQAAVPFQGVTYFPSREMREECKETVNQTNTVLPAFREVSAGGLIVFKDERTEIPDEDLLVELINLRNRSMYLQAYQERAVRDVLDHAEKSARASIMARNASHNLGSHVLPRATSDVVKVRIKELGLWPESPKEDVDFALINSIIDNIDNNGMHDPLPIIEQLTDWREEQFERLTLQDDYRKAIDDTEAAVGALKDRLSEYIQEKSEFLADVTTEPLMTTRPAFLYRDVILPFVENTLLLDNIAANEGIRGFARRSPPELSQRLLHIRVFVDGREITARYRCPQCALEAGGVTGSARAAARSRYYIYPNLEGVAGDALTYLLHCNIHRGMPLHSEVVTSPDGSDVEVALPGPLGQYALYGFLENFIRNVAKHNPAPEGIRDLEILLRLNTKDTNENGNGQYMLTITDNWSRPDATPPVDAVRLAHRLARFEGSSQTTRDGSPSPPPKDVCSLIQTFIEARTTEADGTLRPAAWGIAEMNICAHLLRGSRRYYEEQVPLHVSAESVPEFGGRECLVYHLSIMKPRRACFLLPYPIGNDEARIRRAPRRPQALAGSPAARLDRTDRKEDRKERWDKSDRDMLARYGFALYDNPRDWEEAMRVPVAGSSFGFAVIDSTRPPGKSGSPERKRYFDALERILPLLPFRTLVLVDPMSSQQREPELLELAKTAYLIPYRNPRRDLLGLVEKLATSDFDQDYVFADAVMRQLWKMWLQRWSRQGVTDISVFLEQEQDEAPTSQWATQATLLPKNDPSGIVLLKPWAKLGRNSESSTGIGPHPARLPQPGVPKSQFLAFWDRHGSVARHMKQLKDSIERDAVTPNPRELPFSNFCYISMDKQSVDFGSLFSPMFPRGGGFWSLPYELAEAGRLSILLIDERAAERSLHGGSKEAIAAAQRRGSNNSGSSGNSAGRDIASVPGLPSHYAVAALKQLWVLYFGETIAPPPQFLHWHACAAAKIYIATHFSVNGHIQTEADSSSSKGSFIGAINEKDTLHDSVRLRSETTPTCRVSLSENSRSVFVYPGGGAIKDYRITPDLIIIHQGILDSPGSAGPREILKWLRQLAPMVVVTSGRGIPPQLLQQREKFLPFSLVQQYLLGRNIAKYNLTRAIMPLVRSVRRKGA